MAANKSATYNLILPYAERYNGTVSNNSMFDADKWSVTPRFSYTSLTQFALGNCWDSAITATWETNGYIDLSTFQSLNS